MLVGDLAQPALALAEDPLADLRVPRARQLAEIELAAVDGLGELLRAAPVVRDIALPSQ